jgi:hypothetical protein
VGAIQRDGGDYFVVVMGKTDGFRRVVRALREEHEAKQLRVMEECIELVRSAPGFEDAEAFLEKAVELADQLDF